MTTHKSTLTVPVVCTVETLRQLLFGYQGDSPVMIAMGQSPEGGLDVAQVHCVSQIKEPLEGSEVCLIVPSGAIGKWFEELTEIEAAIEEPPGEPS